MVQQITHIIGGCVVSYEIDAQGNYHLISIRKQKQNAKK
jgi:hypothetical protein